MLFEMIVFGLKVKYLYPLLLLPHVSANLVLRGAANQSFKDIPDQLWGAQVNFGVATLLTAEKYKCTLRLISTNQKFDKQVSSVQQLCSKHLVGGN